MAHCELSTLETKTELNQTSRSDPNLTVGAFLCYSLGGKKKEKTQQLIYTHF